jgi:hypothetical protein
VHDQKVHSVNQKVHALQTFACDVHGPIEQRGQWTPDSEDTFFSQPAAGETIYNRCSNFAQPRIWRSDGSHFVKTSLKWWAASRKPDQEQYWAVQVRVLLIFAYIFPTHLTLTFVLFRDPGPLVL